MLQSHHPLQQQRERRIRGRVTKRVARHLRERVGSLRRLLALALFLAFVGLGAALFFALRPAPEATAEAILLGRGPAGVLGKTGLNAVPPDSIRRRRAPRPKQDGRAERGDAAGSGEASYYGDELRGNPTASGEPFNPEGYTAAHRSLPLGSRLRVTNLTNGESVVVRVNDRGPFSGHRVIDVSKGAARELGMLGGGTTRVRLELLPS